MNKPLRGRPPVPESARTAWAIARPRLDLRLIAKSLGVTHTAVLKWPHVPADRLETVARETGLPRSALRPDLFPPPPAFDPWDDL